MSVAVLGGREVRVLDSPLQGSESRFFTDRRDVAEDRTADLVQLCQVA